MIIVECKPDIMLIKTLSNFSKKEILHGQGRGNIGNFLKKHHDSVGVIDEDPGRTQSKYFENLEIYTKYNHFDIKIQYDNSRNNLVLILCPDLESWVIKTCKISNFNLKKYNLPMDEIRLHEEINSKLSNFSKLIEHLRNNQSDRMIKLLEILRISPLNFKNLTE